MNTKPKLAFIDSSYRKRTKSTIFLRDELKRDFVVVDMWDDSWKGGSFPQNEKINKFDFVLFFQELPNIKNLRNIKAKIIWVPMYDSSVWWPQTTWELLKTVSLKVISFSSTLTKRMKDENFDVLGLQYFLDPVKIKLCKLSQNINIAYWQRTNINIENIMKMLPREKVKKVIIRVDPDPGYKAYSPSVWMKKNFDVETFTGEIGRERYMDRIGQCNVFVAPRKYEGIGMSVVETMSMGMIDIAYDNPTMNEYITDRKNGYLIKSERNYIFDFRDPVTMGKKARKSCELGYETWLREKRKISKFIKSDFKKVELKAMENELFFKARNLLSAKMSDLRFNLHKKF